MFLELVSLYTSGTKADRVKADALIWERASELNLQEMVAKLHESQTSIQDKMAAALAIGYHNQSGEKELQILFEALESSTGESTHYAYRILSAIRKLVRSLKESGTLLKDFERFDDNIKYYSLHGGDDTKKVAMQIYGLIHYGKVAKSIFINPVFPYPPEASQYKCDVFVLMPFSDSFKSIFQDVIEPVGTELNLSVKRGDDFFSSYHIIDEVWFGIFNSRIVIVDCTGSNPNVFYELGIAHTLGRPTILITQEAGVTPFDVRSRRLIHYENNKGAMTRLRDELKEALTMVLDEIPK